MVMAFELVRQQRTAAKALLSRRFVMKTVTTSELKALRHQNKHLTLVNTLSAHTFEKTRIPGSVNIPLESDDFVARVEQAAGGKAKPIVVYCASGACNSSEKAAKKLEAAGFAAVSRYTGGAAAWQKEAGTYANRSAIEKAELAEFVGTDDQVRSRAYEIYEARRHCGGSGDALTDWISAERELKESGNGEREATGVGAKSGGGT
jgi:rhodanese-related sulfurtransferase